MKKMFFLFAATCTLASALTSCAKKTEAATPAPASTVMTATHKVRTVANNLGGVEAFEAIKKNYKGKVVLVDFWATWCPPCRAAMKTIQPVKAALKGKDVVFVYITGETSPKGDWDAQIPNISGEHYRLSNQQWNELGQSLGMSGIPAYMILNKDGSTAWSNASQGGYPGNELVQNEIEVALTK